MNHQTGEASTYQYNGLGHRAGKTTGSPIEPSLPTSKLQDLTINPTKQIEDTIDLTKQYHNLLQRTEDNQTTAYTWDNNVLHAVGAGTSTSEQNTNHYQYLQDELGSPIRVLGEENQQEVYEYDEFGQETVNNSHQAEMIQPFTYTGYQKDSVANTYYAQAREYKAGAGRFTSEDIIKGNGAYPFTLNQYTYCWSSPIGLVDLNGEWPQWAKNAGNTVADFWNTHIYGEEIVEIIEGETIDSVAGVYTRGSVSNVKKSEKYTGSILVKKTVVNASETTLQTGMSINSPTIDLGGGKSIGVPYSVGIGWGKEGIDIDLSLGIDLIAPKGRTDINIGLGGEDWINVDIATGYGLFGNMIGKGMSLPVASQKAFKLFGFYENVNGNITTHVEGGIYLKMGAIYTMALTVLAMYSVLAGQDSLAPALERVKMYWASLNACIS